jgi:GntR family transcriptional regulator
MDHKQTPQWEMDHTSDVPLHIQFEQALAEKIRTGEWKPGERIPAERELMELANISRATVRQALDSLVHKSLLEKVQGRGTFVKLPKLEQSLDIVYSFFEQLNALGLRLHDEVLACEVLDASGELAERLQLAEGDRIIHLKRLRYLKETPLMLNIAYLPHALCPNLTHEEFDTSLYRLLTKKYRLPVLRAVDRFEAIAADPILASFLNVSRHAPVMYVERIAFTTDNMILHIGENYIRGDMCRFRTDLTSHHPSLEIKAADGTASYR